MLEALFIILIILLSPVILIAGFFSLVIIFGMLGLIISIPIKLVKQVIKWQEDQKNISKQS